MKPTAKLITLITLNIIFFVITVFSNSTTVKAVGSNGAWVQVPNMPSSHVWGSGIIPLNNGKVLVTTGFDKNDLTAASELFDPDSRTWVSTGNVKQARILHGNSIVKLNDGTVMIAGGEGPSVSDLGSVELYNPATGAWQFTDPLSTPRRYQAIILQNGKVLVTAGAKGAPDDNRFLSSTEIYDPVTDQWSSSGNLNIPREGVTEIVLLQNGKVLLAGGYTQQDKLTDKAEIYDPATGKWTTSQMPYAWIGATMTVLENGKVLIAGGSIGQTISTAAPSNKSLIYDPDSNTWTQTSALQTARSGHNAALLSDRKVLVLGGGTKSTEIYDPTTAQWTQSPDTRHPQHNGIAVLQNNDVLAVAGDPEGLEAELFTDPTPIPFLDLPFNYEGKEFINIALNPGSWFDHEYPLQNQCPPCLPPVKIYTGAQINKYYRSHNGYDYNAKNGITLNTPVIAAADGIATFVPENESKGAGNVIKITHGNGYQTWYEHLSKEELIVAIKGKEINVKKGQKIGKVGMTGNTNGPHIHFSVFYDRNQNNTFEDDNPLGVVDPLGWEGKEIDPWVEYGGAKSYKLFLGLKNSKNQTIPQTGGELKEDKVKVSVPSNAAPLDFKMNFKYGPFESENDHLESIVPSFFLEAFSNIGDKITTFFQPIEITYDYSNADLLNIKEDTLKLYHFNEDTKHWDALPSTLSIQDKTVAAKTTHFSHFALMGEVKDKVAPTTEVMIQGEKGQDNWYRSNIKVELNGKDNVGGLGLEYTLYTLDNENWEIYNEPLNFDQEGSHTITYQSFDKIGNEGERNTIEFRIDKTLPTISADADRTPDTNDWYNNPVTITFTGQDKDSGIDKCTESITYSKPDIANAVIKGNCTDQAGNSSSTIFSFKYDSTAPTITAKAVSNGKPYTSGSWTNNDVQVEFNCIDIASGVKTVSSSQTISTEGKDQAIKGICEDNAGNKSEVNFRGINIDKTPPEAEIGYNLSIFDTFITGKDNISITTTTIDNSSKLQPKYTITDQADNSLIINTGKIKLGKQVALNIKNLQYNKQPVIILEPNIFFTLALTDRNNKLRQLDQYYSLKEDKKIFTVYTSTSDTTKIYTKAPGSTTYTREDKSGIVLLQLYTENSKLKYSY